MSTRLLVGVLIVFIYVIDGPLAAATRHYTVDDMLTVESIGKVAFDATGSRLIYERLGPFDRQGNYGRQFVRGQMRSKLYAVNIRSHNRPSPIFDQNPGDGYTMTGLSPDGRFLAFGRTSENGLVSGIAPLAGGQPTLFDFSPAYNPVRNLPWTGDSIVVLAGRAGEPDFFAAISKEEVEKLTALWTARNRGLIATASRLASGKFAQVEHNGVQAGGSLVLAGAGDAHARRLADGKFSAWYMSADHTALAALRDKRLAIDPDRPMEHGANMGGIQRQLLILDPRPTAAGQPAREVCDDCDVLSSSLNWSAQSPLLAFVARASGSGWAAAHNYIYDHRTGKTHAVDLGELRPHSARPNGVDIVVSSAWIGDRLAVFAERGDGGANGAARADWYLLGKDRPTNLTIGLKGTSPALVGVGRESLLIVQGGDLWRIDAGGRRRNLTSTIDAPVMPWHGDEPTSSLENPQPKAVVALQLSPEDADSPARLLFVDVNTGRTDIVTAPTASSEFVAAAPAMRRAAVREREGIVTRLLVIDADGSRREVVRLNEQLRTVAGGTPVRIDHEGPRGDKRISWLLLPPGFKAGHPVPTIVDVYPGATGAELWGKWSLDDVHPLNGHILAAHGYAVLYPSMPVRYEQVPRDPLSGLSDEVFSAVDAAVAKGYVDPESLAVQGQSYGAYAVAGLISQTDRFRSAVALAGLYDMISSYGQFDVRRRLDMEQSGLDMFGVSYAETSQGGMGSPPWDDPERYLRNSPILHVKSINTPIFLMSGDRDFLSTTQTEEFFTALTRLNKDAVFVRYYGEDHVYNSPANIRDMWRRTLKWYDTAFACRATGLHIDPVVNQTCADAP